MSHPPQPFDLRPCPFCGGKAHFATLNKIAGHGYTEPAYKVLCLDCGASTTEAYEPMCIDPEPVKQRAIDRWNRRA